MNKMKITKYEIATGIALLFHVAGFIGLCSAKQSWFLSNTPLNLLIMFGLVIWTQPGKNAAFFAFVGIAFTTGMLSEIIGVNTGFLFGKYQYGSILGPQILHVPWIIGINWFTLIYCCGIIISHIQTWFFSKSPAAQTLLSPQVQFISFIADGAMLATFFDFIIEPAAVKFGYWTWLGDGNIPFTNFLSWLVISTLLLTVFKLLSFTRHNQFAVHLLIIETLFFTALKTFL